MFYLDLRDCLDRNGSRENGNGIFLGNGSFAHRCALLSGPCWRIGEGDLIDREGDYECN